MTLTPLTAQRLFIVSLLDLLATSAPLGGMDDLVEDVLGDVDDATLAAVPCELCGSGLDVLSWIEPSGDGAGCHYSLGLVQYLGTLLDRYSDNANPLHVEGAIQAIMAFLPEPSVVDINCGPELIRFSSSPFGRGHLGWTGVVCLSAEPCR